MSGPQHLLVSGVELLAFGDGEIFIGDHLRIASLTVAKKVFRQQRLWLRSKLATIYEHNRCQDSVKLTSFVAVVHLCNLGKLIVAKENRLRFSSIIKIRTFSRLITSFQGLCFSIH